MQSKLITAFLPLSLLTMLMGLKTEPYSYKTNVRFGMSVFLSRTCRERPQSANSVEKSTCCAAKRGAEIGAKLPPHTGVGSSFAILRRFCAVAANVNSSLAPFGPLRRSLVSPMIFFRCANSISTFFRACLDAA